MHLRPAAVLLALGLTLAAVSGCAEQVKGQARADANATQEAADPTTTSKKPSASTATSKPANPTAQKQGDVKIATKKKATGLETCGVLKTADIEAATGGKSSADGGCIHTTTGPSTVITQMVTVPDVVDQEGEKKQIEIGGNTAWQVSASKEDCQVTVMLTDDPNVITPAFSVSVLAIEELDTCATALKLATEGFNRIPGA
ncbi:hypothetical protein SAMN04488074_105426 [Lentzea albidocapillata subsp. violacea]|uniref:DUF3558 domain-containing protein n=1 Tax=Lentzea albidocapillata subsp. violacea TaxID=128104 RepID=A0A1G9BUJ2_9PSEU|nr:hypothetical protein [Lentzea albidocapillata]SDK43096.1 hypothetical protein SAMN04488074_105426 [Lentzea albidocapillata subsp. violacea]